jgi:hypothetical protein
VLFARHKLSRCIHSLQDETGTCFKCGRGMSYKLVKRKPDFVHPLCNTCFRPDGMWLPDHVGSENPNCVNISRIWCVTLVLASEWTLKGLWIRSHLYWHFWHWM